MGLSGNQENTQFRIFEAEAVDGSESVVVDGMPREVDTSSAVSAPSSQLCDILEHVTHGIIVMDCDRRVISWNPKFQEIMRFPDELLKVGMPSQELGLFLAGRGDYGKGNLKDLNAARRAFLWAGGSTRSEIHLSNGRDYEVFAKPTPEGELVISYTDITERKQAERELTLKSELLSNVLENIGQGVVMFDSSRRLLVWNDRYKEILQFPDDLLQAGRSNRELALSLAKRGDLGEGDPEELTAERLKLLWSGDDTRSEITIQNEKSYDVVFRRTEGGGLVITYTDITERKQLEEKSSQSRKLFSRAFQSNPNLMALVDPSTGEHFDVNEAWLNTLKLSREDVIGKTSFDFDHWADFRDRDRILKKHTEQGRVRNFIGQLKAKDGTLIDCSFSTEPIKMDQLELVLWTVIDITEQRERENSLNESEGRYKDATRIANLGHWVYDEVADRLVYGSAELARIHGVTHADYMEIVTSTENDIKRIHPDDRKIYGKAIKDAQRRATPFDVEYRIVRPNGEVRHIREIGEPVCDETGKLIRSRGTLQDITERKRVEEALRESRELLNAVMDAVPAMINAKNRDLRYVLMNRFQAEFYGVDAEQAVGQRATDLAGLDYGSYMESLDRKVFDTGEPLPYFEDPSLDGFGNSHTLLTTKVPLKDIDGNVNNVVTVALDISERKKLEESLLAARESAEHADLAKSEFLATMSHELRTPLNAIIGFSEIIKDERIVPDGSTKYREYADDISRSGRHLLALINDILDLSKVETGNEEFHEETIEISEIAKEIEKLVMGLAQEGEIELELDLPEVVPDLYADERKVKQILLNLLSNAIKFTPNGGKVILKIWASTEIGYFFQIIDSGIGISLEDVPKAFTPFQQIDSGLNRKHDGTGLGLPLTKAFVESHGGDLDLQSEVDVGTTVTVRFPAERIIYLPRDAKAANAADRKAG